MDAIYEHVASQELPQRNLASWAISTYYPEFTPPAAKTVVSQVLCMIAEYHLACATKSSTTTSPILPEAVEQYLPLLVDYACPAGTGITDVRVCDHKAKSLLVGVWLHHMDMSLSWEKEALETLVQLRHSRGPLLSYFLAPRTGNLCYEEVVSRVLQENWEKHEEVKEKFRSSLNRSRHWQTRLTQELDELSQGMEATTDGKVQKDIEERMNVLQTSLQKVEPAVAVNENHLEESWIREEKAHQGDQGQSDSSEKHEGNIVVEEPEESGLTGVESTGPLEIQGTEPSMEVDVDDILPLTSGDATTVTAKEDEMLMGGPTSVTGEMAQLQVASPDSHKP